jgi:hypothetical protein
MASDEYWPTVNSNNPCNNNVLQDDTLWASATAGGPADGTFTRGTEGKLEAGAVEAIEQQRRAMDEQIAARQRGRGGVPPHGGGGGMGAGYGNVAGMAPPPVPPSGGVLLGGPAGAVVDTGSAMCQKEARSGLQMLRPAAGGGAGVASGAVDYGF